MRASILRKLWILALTGYATLRITLIVLYRVYLRGGYPRDYGDRWLKWWAKKLVDSVGMRYMVHDPHGLVLEPGTPYIIMSNHRSHYDIPLVILTMPGSIRMLTKKELFRVPLWGRGMKAGEFMSIDRSNIEQAKTDLAAAREKMESGIVIWISPEGTRSQYGHLGGFKKGGFIMAIEAGARIIPVGIQGTEKVLRPKTLEFNLDREVSVDIGMPIDASRYTLEQKELLMEEVRKSIAELCGEGGGSAPEEEGGEA